MRYIIYFLIYLYVFIGVFTAFKLPLKHTAAKIIMALWYAVFWLPLLISTWIVKMII